MATRYSDLAAWAQATLEAAPEVTGAIVDGSAGIFGSGDLTPEFLSAAQQTRMAGSGSGSGVLAVLVMDRGETKGGNGRVARCSVFIYDRSNGYGEIRDVRDAVIDALVGKPVLLSRGAAIVTVRYDERGGHEKFADFDLDFEEVKFEGDLVYSKDQEFYGG